MRSCDLKPKFSGYPCSSVLVPKPRKKKKNPNPKKIHKNQQPWTQCHKDYELGRNLRVPKMVETWNLISMEQLQEKNWKRNSYQLRNFLHAHHFRRGKKGGWKRKRKRKGYVYFFRFWRQKLVAYWMGRSWRGYIHTVPDWKWTWTP